MTPTPISTSIDAVRRLTVTKQRLSGPAPARASAEAVASLVRDLPYVQWDPVAVVAPSHLLSLWARLGAFPPAALDRLMWEEKRLLLLWTPIASLVSADDYPLYASQMSRFPGSLSNAWGSQRETARRFLASHASLRAKILRELRGGPLRLGQFQDHARTLRAEGDWNPRSDVARMLEYLHLGGRVMVVGHEGNQNLWGLTADFLRVPPRDELPSPEEVDRLAAQKAIRGLGTATRREVNYYFVRGRYGNLPQTLRQLEESSQVHRIAVPGLREKEPRYVHREDVPLLERLASRVPEPRLALLPPFDNMIQMQERTRRLFDFDYVREQFLPREKRRFGMWVLPVLWGERLVGRLDLRLDKQERLLRVIGAFVEPGAPSDRAFATALRDALEELGRRLGAKGVGYPRRVPAAWQAALR